MQVTFLRIDCDKAEEGLKTTPYSVCALNALAIDEPLEYACLYFFGGGYADVGGYGRFVEIILKEFAQFPWLIEIQRHYIRYCRNCESQ